MCRHVTSLTLIILASIARAEEPSTPFRFADVGTEVGLFPHVADIQGHGAAWGDATGNGWLDLFVGTFDTGGSKPCMLLRNHKGQFQLDDQPALRLSGRVTGVVFADLNNNGHLDLYVGSMPAAEDSRLAQRLGHPLRGCSMFRNDGSGRFTDISEGNGACPPAFGGRSVTVLDYDGDGLLDLLVGEDPLPGYNGSPTKSSRLFRNLGGMKFEDVSRQVGLPENVPGLGVAAGDLTGNGWPDLFLASSDGGNVLLVNDGKGRFREMPGSRDLFAWPDSGSGNMICGVMFCDVNRDGRLDIVLGQHYKTPWVEPVPVRMYLNRGSKNGEPVFEDVTERVGLQPLPMKAPHVELQDFDNDGWPDLFLSVVKFADGKPHPLIYRHQGLDKDGLPRFREDTLAVNDFPTPEDRAIRRSGPFFEKMLKDGKITYTAPGPTGDFDRDGRIDMFLPSWWAESRSLLLRNETPGGNWLRVRVVGSEGVNRMGISSRVKVYPAGKLGEASALLGCREIATGFGYASGQPATAHFGLGDVSRVDVEVELPHGKGTITRKGIDVNAMITVDR